MKKFYTNSTSHLIGKLTKFISPITIWTAKCTLSWWSVFAAWLITNTTSSIIRLMFIKLFHCSFWSWCLWKCPFWEILFCWRVSCCFWNISTRSNSTRSWYLIFKARTTTTETKSILRFIYKFRLSFNFILGSRVTIIVATCHSRLSSNLRSTNSWSTIIIWLNWIIKE